MPCDFDFELIDTEPGSASGGEVWINIKNHVPQNPLIHETPRRRLLIVTHPYNSNYGHHTVRVSEQGAFAKKYEAAKNNEWKQDR